MVVLLRRLRPYSRPSDAEGRMGRKLCPQFAVGGVLLALVMLFGLGMGDVLEILPYSIGIGVILFFVAAWNFGPIAARRCARSGRSWLGAAGVGAVTAVACLFTAAVAGSLVLYLFDYSTAHLESAQTRAWSYIGKPVVWVFIYGGAPALVVGMAFGAVLRKRVASDSSACLD